MTQPQYEFFDFYRAGLKAAGGTIKTSLEDAQRLRNQQLSAIKESLASHAQVATMVDDAKGFEDLAAVPGKLFDIQCQAVLSYWNGIYQMASESQNEVTSRMQAQAEQVRENFQKVLGAATNGQNPMRAALLPLVNIASSALALSARANEEATKLAAVQLGVAKAGIRQATERGHRTRPEETTR